MQLRLLLVVLVTLLVGCNRLAGEAKSIRFTAPTSVLKNDEAVIISRLREHTPSFSPTYSITEANGEMVVNAKGAPPDSEIQYLLSHRGMFVARSEGGLPWFSQNDIVDAQAALDNQQRTVLQLKLSEKASARVARITSASAGGLVLAELDGETLASARLSGPITGGSLQITVSKKPAEALLICTILRFGHLSFTPESIKVQAQR